MAQIKIDFGAFLLVYFDLNLLNSKSEDAAAILPFWKVK